MKKEIILLLCMLSFKPLFANKPQGLAIENLIQRILPHHSGQISVILTPSKNSENVTISTKNHKIHLEGNSISALSFGLSYYLRNICHASTSWTGNQLNLPKKLPLISKKIVLNCSYEKRWMYNYCTFGYTMAFWDWERWEKELDWMALHGVNTALALVGQEAVWQNTLRKYNFTDKEIQKFIPGPAFVPWWLMGNLEGWGGPVNQDWIDHQKELQQKIVKRMRELGINPIFQGFYSMVPDALSEKFPTVSIIRSGKWLNFQRPATLLPTGELFFQIAKTYYEEQNKLYGNTDYFIGDLFHEGAVPKNINVKKVATGVFKAMTDFNPQATWVMQAWQENPNPQVLETLPKGKVLVIDLMAESSAMYGGDPYSNWSRQEGLNQHNFIFSILPNFGGRTGMSGQIDSIQTKINRLNSSRFKEDCKGLGASPEAILQDPISYDLLFDRAWQVNGQPFNLDQWLQNYTTARYGSFNQEVFKAWQILRKTVYNSKYNNIKSPPYESIFTTRPAWNKTMTSTWGYDSLDYNPDQLKTAWKILIKNREKYKQADTYQYDLVNITRQIIDNYGHRLYKKLQLDYQNKNQESFAQTQQKFLTSIIDLDELLSTRKEFLLGTWLESAKTPNTSYQTQITNTYNARLLITTWTFEPNDLNDYAYREYSGLLKDYYFARWKLFFDAIQKQQKLPTKADFFKLEKAFTLDKKTYPSTPQNDSWKVVQRLYQKYKNI